MSRPRQFNRDDVLEKAMQIFWSQGFAGTSIQDLVKATGLNRGSLYGAFQDKENLYAEALDRYLGTEMQRCHSALKSGAPLKPVLRDLFLSIARTSESELTRRGCFVTNTAVECLPGEDRIGLMARDAILSMIHSMTDALRRAQMAGEISPALDSESLAYFLVTSINGLRVMVRAFEDTHQHERTVGHILSVLDVPPATIN